MKYQDFVITFHERDGNQYTFSVESPAGEVQGTLCLPDDLIDPNLVRHRLVRGVYRDASRDARWQSLEPSKAPSIPVEEFGQRLFEALLADSRLKCLLATSHEQATEEVDCGLRIQVRMDSAAADMCDLAQLPWEFLHSEEFPFLSLRRVSPVIRYLSGARKPTSSKRPDALRILVVIASPSDQPALDEENERKAIEDSRTAGEVIRYKFLDQATRENLRRALADEEYHVLHFIGHGGVGKQDGYLMLEDEHGLSDAISADNLVELIGDFKSIRLVFLNACQTAQLASGSGVATALVKNGFAAVIAMQFPISDSAAITFSATVYRRLLRGERLEVAVSEGRSMIRAGNEESFEWGTPVLYSQLEDGMIFSPGIPKPRRSLFWTIAGSLTFVYCVFRWVQTTFVHEPSIIFGLLLGGPLTLVTLVLAGKYQLAVNESSLWDRLPYSYGLTREKTKSLYWLCQLAGYLLFLLIPMGSQVYFLGQLSNAKIYYKDADLFSWGLEQFSFKKYVPFLEAIQDHFRFAESDGVTYFPFWQSWYFVIFTTFLFVYFVRVTTGLFSRPGNTGREGDPQGDKA